MMQPRLATAAAAALLLLASLGHVVEGFRTPSQWVAASSKRARGRVAMEVNSAVSNAPVGQGPYKGPASSPLLDSVRYPHDMKQFNLKVRRPSGRRSGVCVRWRTRVVGGFPRQRTPASSHHAELRH